MVLFEARSSEILYNVLQSLVKDGILNESDIFLIPLNVCPIVPAIFLKAGVRFDFIDISLTTLCIDEDAILTRIRKEKNIKGVLFVKTYGTNYDASNLFKEIRTINHDIFLIDDSCLKEPDLKYDIDQSLSDLIIYSTGYSKYVDIGWGGFGFLKDSFKYHRNKILFKKDHLKQLTKNMQASVVNDADFHYVDNDWLGSDIYPYEGFNEYARHIKNVLPKIKKHKDSLNKIYKKELHDEIQIKEEFSNWRFSIIVDDKEKILKEIFRAGLFASSHYKDIGSMYSHDFKGAKSNAQKFHSSVINLFNDFRFSDENAHKVSKLINNYI